MTRLLLLLLLAPVTLAGAYDRGELNELNDLYKNDRFEEALEGYNKIVAQEPANPWGWYNAGNALFRLNRTGPAVFHYARAFRLNPRDPNIRFNLEFALRQTGQALLPDGMPRALHYVYYLLSDMEIKAFAICLFWLACLAGAAGFLLDGAPSGAAASRTAVITAVMCLGCLGWLGARQNSPFAGAGVITKTGGARLLSGPGENFKACASAPEGLLVKVLDSIDDDYYEIGLPKEGVKGWALKTEVEKI
ncbi:MAG: hypothetical protein A2234_08650 [Elusimicrobia bacterium RIFOXYA2_FULL_58_8]|nr:MAG: hypothetical protein A2285_08075 [Elusimicrobia bacterium RIFOXYA12_FULL_57_11]OGS12924.1 MAG: hypothetical protein A2234_08650 [Elusimicrobia bacterium RIFOXYA2_FULL_58_8]